MKDKIGRDYDVLLALQRRQLSQLKLVLKPAVYSDLELWVQLTNGKADPEYLEQNDHAERYTRGGLHSVPIGHELHEFIMDWGVSEEDAQLL